MASAMAAVAVSTEASGSSVYVCEANCGTAAGWTGGALDTAASLTAAFAAGAEQRTLRRHVDHVGVAWIDDDLAEVF
jgi:hypothetical protein